MKAKSGNWNVGKASKTLLLVSITVLVFTSSPIYYLYALNIDGTVSESEWVEWFTDTTYNVVGHYTGNLYFTAYWYVDSSYLYVAVKTTDQTITILDYSMEEANATSDADIAMLSNTTDTADSGILKDTESVYVYGTYDKAIIGIDVYPYGIGTEDIMFGIQTRSYSEYGYNPYAKRGTSHGWGSAQALPTGCAFVAGSTNGYRSYELRVPVSLLGLQPGDVVTMAFAIYDRPSYWGQAYNYHPDALMWCNPDNWEPTPPLPIPEVPIGTLLLIATAFAAYFLLRSNRRNTESNEALQKGPHEAKPVGA